MGVCALDVCLSVCRGKERESKVYSSGAEEETAQTFRCNSQIMLWGKLRGIVSRAGMDQ